MSERRYWIGFNMVKGIGPVRVRRLLEHFDKLSIAWDASAADLKEAGIDRRTLQNLKEARRNLDLVAEQSRLDKLGIAVLTWEDEDYPALLKQLRPIDQAPPVLYLRGTLTREDTFALAIVGTRRATPYGKQVTHRLARQLAASGLTIVSGLATGIDSEAHQAALEAGGRTIAVLPCGMDQTYPRENRRLLVDVIQNGAVMSPFPLGTQPESHIFAPRNRVISGLSKGVLVTEAGHKSGALLTAGYALEHGREVFAVPGNITAKGSEGTNQLIQDGAYPVTEPDDILTVLNLEHLNSHIEARSTLPEMTTTEQTIVQHLSDDPLHVDDLTHACGLPIHVVNSTLTMLELKGVIRQVGPMTYVLN